MKKTKYSLPTKYVRSLESLELLFIGALKRATDAVL